MLANNSKRVQTFPSKQKVEQFVMDLQEFLFVCDISNKLNISKLESHLLQLQRHFEDLLHARISDDGLIQQHSQHFFKELPAIYDALILDAEAILAADPAARTLEEVMAAYPGFFATVVYRVAHQVFNQGLQTLARFLSEFAHSKTGIDIHPGATIGHSFVIDHGTGIVIGETSIIGNSVTIYQGVTLGALNVSKENAASKRHPTVEDNVVIYAGATILGGETFIGRDSIIGGNVWLTYSVPANSIVYHKSEIHIKDNNPFPEPLNFVI